MASLLDPTNTLTQVSGFIGFISDTAFSTISITGPGNDFFSIDDIYVSGDAVLPEIPLPAAFPLMLAGLAGLGFASRRKKS